MSAALPSRRVLAARATVRFIGGVAVLASMLFLAAGTWRWWQAWAYLATLFTPILLMLAWLLWRDPVLLELRMREREPEVRQGAIQSLGAVVYLLVYVLAGLDHRFGWTQIDAAVVIAADVLLLLGYALFVRVLLENRFASRVLEVQQSQRVIDTGPYAVVRHPMYVAVLVIFAATPIALGTWWGILLVLPEVAVIAARIEGEERLLADGLAGYEEYVAHVHWRLLPGIW